MHPLLRVGTVLVLFLLNTKHVECKKTIRKANTDIPLPAFPQNECRIIFNEINLYPQSNFQYLEMSKYCKEVVKVNRPISMEQFRLIVISHDAKLMAVCKFEGQIKHSVGRYWFYTAGGSGVSDSNFKINDCEVDIALHDLNSGNKVLPAGVMHPVGLILLYNKNINVLQNIQLRCEQNRCESVIISEIMENKIMQNIQDFYVFGSSTMFQACEYFTRFYASYTATWINILRDYQDEGAEDRSLSRCSTLHLDKVSLPMQPAVWVYTTKTPNQKNRCAEGLPYVIETQQQVRKIPRPNIENSNYKCFSLTEDPANAAHVVANPQTYQHGLNEAFEAAALTGPNENLEVPESYRAFNEHNYFGPVYSSDSEMSESSCPSDSEPTEFEETYSEEIMDFEDNSEEAQGQPKQSWKRDRFKPQPLDVAEFENKVYHGHKHIMDKCDTFSENIKREIQSLPGTPIDLDDILQEDTCSWFEWLTDVKKFRCKFCNLLLNQQIIFDNYGSPDINYIMWKGVAQLTGVNRRSNNKLFLNKHKESSLHLASVDYFKLVDEGKRGEELQASFERKNGPWRNFLNSTENLILAGFQAVKMGLTFNNFSKLTDLLKYFGNDVGKIHNSNDGIIKILDVLSNRMHQDFINHLLSSNKEVSIMCDCMTDVSGEATFAVLFQTYDSNENVKVFMYRILHACEGEKGVQLFKLLKKSLVDDGIDGYIKTNLIGFSADGGANIQKTFKRELSAFIDNELIGNHCMNHRVELLSKHCFEQFPYLVSIDKTINDLCRFFTNKSAKRKAVLHKWSFDPDTSKIKKYELKRIIKIRWINSKKRAISTLLTHWDSVIDALEDIAQDKSFKFDQREKAIALADKLKDPTFLATLTFVLDISAELAAVSMMLQRHSNSIIGKKSTRVTLVNRLELLKIENGPNLKLLLKNSDFVVPEDEPIRLDKLTLQKFETENIKYGTQPTSKRPLDSPNKLNFGNRLYENRTDYINAMIDQVHLYFPEDPLDTFDIFDISNWPSNVEELDLYGLAEINVMTRKLKWNIKWGMNEDILRQDWNELKRSVFYDPEFVNFLKETPEVTWAHYLKKTDGSIRWTPNTRKVIGNAITISCSSATAEHLFSLYSYMKTNRRFNLLPETTEKLVRIRYYADQNIQNFNFLPPTYDFVKRYSKANDRSRRITWKKAIKPTQSPLTSSEETDYDDL